MVRTITVTETITRLAIGAPTSTAYPRQEEEESFAATSAAVGLPAFLSTFKFLLTLLAVFISTTFVSYLILHTKAQILKVYSGKEQGDGDGEGWKATALCAARCVALSHALTVLILVLRTRQALGSLAPVAYEVFTLMLGVEAAVVVVVGGAFGVVKGMEMFEEERMKAQKGKKAE